MARSGMHIRGGALALALCLALVGCSSVGSSDDNAQQKSSTVTITTIGQDDSGKDSTQKGKQDSAGRNHNTLSTCLGTIAEKFADDHGNPLVERSMAQLLFTYTINEEEFKLPCPPKAFLDKEWKLEQGFSYEGIRYDPGFEYEVGLWHKGDENSNIKIKLRNTTDHVVTWDELTVVGLTIRPLDTYVSFECKAGIDRDSNLDKLLEVLGCNDQSALLDNKVIVEYHVALYETPFYDMNGSIFGNIAYDWNKTGKAMTSISFELLDPWDKELWLSDEELAEKKKKREEEAKESGETQQNGDFSNVSDYVGRTVEGADD